MPKINRGIQRLLIALQFIAWVAPATLGWFALMVIGTSGAAAALIKGAFTLNSPWTTAGVWMFAAGSGLFSLWELLFFHTRYALMKVPTRTKIGILLGVSALLALHSAPYVASSLDASAEHPVSQKKGSIWTVLLHVSLIGQFYWLIADLRQDRKNSQDPS